MAKEPEFMSVTQAAEEKGCSRQTIYHKIHEKRINVTQPGGFWLVIRDEKFENLKIGYSEHRQKQEEFKARLDTLQKQVDVLTAKIDELECFAVGRTKEPAPEVLALFPDSITEKGKK